MRDDRIETFMQAYTPALEATAKAHPAEYPWYAQGLSVDTVAGRMRTAFAGGTFNHDSRAIRAACKAVGIKHTRGAMLAYFRGE